jgi:hypothetical protein
MNGNEAKYLYSNKRLRWCPIIINKPQEQLFIHSVKNVEEIVSCCGGQNKTAV